MLLPVWFSHLGNYRHYVFRHLWSVMGPNQLKSFAGDALNANGKLLRVRCSYVLKWPLTTKLDFDKTQDPVMLQNHAADIKTLLEYYTAGLVPPSLKMLASMFFNDYGP